MPESRDPQLDELRRRARRRLVGAVVLALAAAVLVPMLLESDPRPLGEDVAVRIPPVDDGKFVNKVGEKAKAEPAPAARPAPATPPPAAAATEPSKAAPAEAAPSVPPATSSALASAEQRVLAPPRPPAREPAPPPSPEATPAASEPPARAADAAAPADAAKAAAKPAEPPKAGGFSVQLAAFIDDKGANALAGRLKKSGYPAYTEPYGTSRGTVWRVRVGPYPSREAAEGARDKLKADGQNGIITAAK